MAKRAKVLLPRSMVDALALDVVTIVLAGVSVLDLVRLIPVSTVFKRRVLRSLEVRRDVHLLVPSRRIDEDEPLFEFYGNRTLTKLCPRMERAVLIPTDSRRRDTLMHLVEAKVGIRGGHPDAKLMTLRPGEILWRGSPMCLSNLLELNLKLELDEAWDDKYDDVLAEIGGRCPSVTSLTLKTWVSAESVQASALSRAFPNLTALSMPALLFRAEEQPSDSDGKDAWNILPTIFPNLRSLRVASHTAFVSGDSRVLSRLPATLEELRLERVSFRRELKARLCPEDVRRLANRFPSLKIFDCPFSKVFNPQVYILKLFPNLREFPHQFQEGRCLAKYLQECSSSTLTSISVEFCSLLNSGALVWNFPRLEKLKITGWCGETHTNVPALNTCSLQELGVFRLKYLRQLEIFARVTFSESDYDSIMAFANLKHLEKLTLAGVLLSPSTYLYTAFGCALGDTSLVELRLEPRGALECGDDLLRIRSLLQPLCVKRRMQLVHVNFGEQRLIDEPTWNACARALKSFFGCGTMLQYEMSHISVDFWAPVVGSECVERPRDTHGNVASSEGAVVETSPSFLRPLAALFEVNRRMVHF